MPTNFPTSVDVLVNPTPTDSLNAPAHSAQHANANDAIEAIEAFALALPRGKLALSTITSDTNSLNSEVQRGTVSFTAVTGRLYKVTWFEPSVKNGVNASVNNLRLRLDTVGGTQLQGGVIFYAGSSYEQGSVMHYIGTFTAGTRSVFATVQTNAASSSLYKGSSTAPAYILVEDIGVA
jgi:hypothetical protein